MSDFELTKQSYIDKHNQSLIANLRHDDFRRQKADWVQLQITKRGAKSYLDFGFGTGELLEDISLNFAQSSGLTISGVEPSESLRRELEMRSPSRVFHKIASSLDVFEDGSQDLITIFNVLHHIPPATRKDVAEQLIKKLSPDGALLIWEHNPFNLGTQFIVCRCEYDHDAVLLPMMETLKLFSSLKLELKEYVNVTPPGWHQKTWARRLETACAGVPLGAQYRVILRKPA